MKPPICAVCGHRATRDQPDRQTRLVRFADYEPLPDDVAGHPKGLEWFCEEHREAAEALRELPLDAALNRLRARFGRR